MDEKELIIAVLDFQRKPEDLVIITEFAEHKVDRHIFLDIPVSPIMPDELLIVVHAEKPKARPMLGFGRISLMNALVHKMMEVSSKSDLKVVIMGDENPGKNFDEILFEKFKPESLLSPIINFSHQILVPESFLESKQRKLQKIQSKKITPRRLRNP